MKILIIIQIISSKLIAPLMEDNQQYVQKTGLNDCFGSFETVYCYRKLIQFILSILFIIVIIIILVLYIRKYWVTRPYWLSSLLIIAIFSLISNILFCFYNRLFWIYAIEVYFKNMYYLILVSYICYNYILKHTPEEKEDLMQQLNINMNIPQNMQVSNQRIIFYLVVGILTGGYLGILITSLVYEVQHEGQENNTGVEGNNADSTTKFCQLTWYFILHVVTIILSIILVWVMLKNQKQEYKKFTKFKRDGNSISISAERAHSGMSNGGNFGSFRQSQQQNTENDKEQHVYNPFKNLWIWVGINVFSQVVNLVQSGFEINLKPPQCLINPSNPSESNVLALIFVLITFYLGYAATIWYILFAKTLDNRTGVDRTVLYPEQYRISGNIELSIPSRGETVTLSLPEQL